MKRDDNQVWNLSLLLTIGFLILSVFGCSGGGGGSSSDSTPSTPPTGTPSISTQGVVDFGVAVIPNSPTRVVTIKNNGTGTLDIGQISLLQAGTPFTITNDACSNQRIAASGACQLSVQLGTNAGSSQADFVNTLSIPSNDSARNLVQLSVAGKARKYFVNINEIRKDNCPSTIGLLVAVTDAAGLTIQGLAQGSFTLFENGLPQGFISFNTETSKLSVAMLLDYSTSILDLEVLEAAVQAFIDQLKTTDEVSIMKFAAGTYPASFTFTEVDGNKNTLKAFIDEPLPFAADSDFFSGTYLNDVVFSAVEAISSPARTKPRKAVIVLSDGLDVGSTRTSLTDAINLAVQEGITVFTIAITNAVDPQPQIMKQLADETGGSYFEAPTSSEVQDIYLAIAGILSDQYLIEYPTASNGGATISLDIEVNNAGDLGEASRDAVGCP